MEGLLECSLCGENYDLRERQPKLLPCGHTLCLACITTSYSRAAGRIRCPYDFKECAANPDMLAEDLQLVCWLDAAAQGVLECMYCSLPFDRLGRRPMALDCGHVACRLCLSDAGADSGRDSSPSLPPPASRLDGLGSLDEPWGDDCDSQGDGDDASSFLSSLPSDDGDLAPRVDCQVAGCGRGVRARDHHHLLRCLDGSAGSVAREARARRANSAHLGARTGEELLAELTRLMRGCNMGGAVSPVEAVRSGGVNLDSPVDAGKLGTNLEAMKGLLADLRRVVEHQNSPRSEKLDVFHFTPVNVNSSLPDLLNQKSEASLASVVFANEAIKESKVEVDVWEMSLSSPQEMRVKKETLLHSVNKVWKLTGLDCWCDPEWSLRLLRKVAPDVEQLQLRYPTRQHLQVVRDCMPYLRRLEVRGWGGIDLLEDPFSFDLGPASNTLEWLEVFLPRPTALSLLRSHRRTLRKVRVVVSDEWMSTVTPEDDGADVLDVTEQPVYPDSIDGFSMNVDDEGWCVVPYAEDAMRSRCWDDLLSEYGGAGAGNAEDDAGEDSPLVSLSLLWPSSHTHDYYHCRQFARTLGKVRPHLTVDCDVCRQKPARFA